MSMRAVGVTPGAIPGTQTNNNAPAGAVGEYIESNVTAGSALPLTTNVALNVTSISLTPGDWDVSGDIGHVIAATTTTNALAGGASSTTATLQPNAFCLMLTPPSTVTGGGNNIQSIPVTRFSLAVTTTIFLIGFATFGTAACSAFGTIHARRVR